MNESVCHPRPRPPTNNKLTARQHNPLHTLYTHSGFFRWSYGTIRTHVLLPVHNAVTGLVGGITGQCRRARDGVVGAGQGAVQFVRDGVEVAWICFGVLVLGRSPAEENVGAGKDE